MSEENAQDKQQEAVEEARAPIEAGDVRFPAWRDEDHSEVVAVVRWPDRERDMSVMISADTTDPDYQHLFQQIEAGDWGEVPVYPGIRHKYLPRSVREPYFITEDQTVIDCMVVLFATIPEDGQGDGEEMEYAASSWDVEAHGRYIHALLMAGTFGEVAPYQVNIQALRGDVRRRIEYGYEDQLKAGFTYTFPDGNEGRVSLESSDRDTIASMALQAQLAVMRGRDKEQTYRDMGSMDHVMTAEQALDFNDAMDDAHIAIRDKYRSINDQIDAIADDEEDAAARLDGITWG